MKDMGIRKYLEGDEKRGDRKNKADVEQSRKSINWNFWRNTM